MDRVNAKTDFERALLAMYADGKVDVSTMKAILAAHRQELQNTKPQTIPTKEIKTPG